MPNNTLATTKKPTSCVIAYAMPPKNSAATPIVPRLVWLRRIGVRIRREIAGRSSPAKRLHRTVREEQCRADEREEVDDRAAVDHALDELAEVFRHREVVEHCADCRRRGVGRPIDHIEEEERHQTRDG